MGNGTTQLDFTKVSTIHGDGEKSESYEVELEMISEDYDRQSYVEMDKQASWVMKILYDTKYLYTVDEYFRVIHLFNSVGPKDPLRARNVADTRIMEKPRNLHLRDLVRGGIIDNPQSVFMVNHKIDGERRFLLITEDSFWLVHPPTSSVRYWVGYGSK